MQQDKVIEPGGAIIEAPIYEDGFGVERVEHSCVGPAGEEGP